MKCDKCDNYAEPCKFCDKVLCYTCQKKGECKNDCFKSSRWKVWRIKEILQEFHEVLE